MTPIYLTEEDVERLLPMDACIDAVEDAFLQWARGEADNRPRARATVSGAMLHTLSAGSNVWGRLAAKIYATSRGGARFVVLLFDARTSDLLAVIEGDRLGQTRTGAASGVATKFMARRDARVLAVLGTGWQARGQARAIAAVRRLESIRVFGRNAERLRAFARDVEAACRVAVTPCDSAADAARQADIVVTATSSPTPVLEGAWLRPGTHVNAVGNNRPGRSEIDGAVVERAGLLVVDSIDQARLEAGDLLAVDGGAPLDGAIELKEIVAGRHPGRRNDSEITLFKSIGIGLEDLAAASVVYDRARVDGIGRPLVFDGRGVAGAPAGPAPPAPAGPPPERESPVRARIESILRRVFAPTRLDVRDDSARHAGHAGAAAGGGHFDVVIVSPLFEGKSLLERHRMVNEALRDLIGKEIHAIALRTLAPSEPTGHGPRE